MKPLRIGIVGCGAIGTELARSIETRFSKKATLEALCELDLEKAKTLANSLKYIPQILPLNELVESVDLVIEAASLDAVPQVLKLALEKGKDVMVMSVGGLLGNEEFFEKAQKKGIHIYVPSGAIGGIDALKAAHLGEVSRVVLVTTKPPASYEGAPYVVKHQIRLQDIHEDTVLFEGPADEAVKGFPRNINVSAILSLCGLGPKKTWVKIVASPASKWNSHEITVEGAFGKFTAHADNYPLPSNPKTSALSPLSAIAMIQGILSHVRIGT